MALVGIVLWAGLSAAQGATFRVIVNAANPVRSMTREEVSDLFLKKTGQWEDGETVIPVDQASKSPVRERFSQEIHRRTVGAIKSFWQKLIFSGRDTPPTEMASDEQVVEFVASNPGAVGYVSPSAALDRRVKLLEVTP